MLFVIHTIPPVCIDNKKFRMSSRGLVPLKGVPYLPASQAMAVDEEEDEGSEYPHHICDSVDQEKDLNVERTT